MCRLTSRKVPRAATRSGRAEATRAASCGTVFSVSSTNETPAEGSHSEIREIPVREGEHVSAEDVPAPLGLRGQLIRFVLVGGLSAVVDLGTYQILMIVFGVPYTVAKIPAFILGTLTAYALNRRYTFRAEPSWRKFAVTMALYAIMFVVQYSLTTGIAALLLHNVDGIPQWVATTIGFVIGQGVATVTNFIVQRAFIFRS